jgi:iron(III) transport system permease protein
VLLAYLLMFLPRALVSLRAGIAQAPVELENMARSLGRSPLRALWLITAPGGSRCCGGRGAGVPGNHQ